jgi:GNAT superfamily N-acetyltransferase
LPRLEEKLIIGQRRDPVADVLLDHRPVAVDRSKRHIGHELYPTLDAVATFLSARVMNHRNRGRVSQALRIIPANEARWEDLQAIFGTRGDAAGCQCQRFKLAPKESFGSFPVEERMFRLRTQTNCGQPDADTTSGLVAYMEGVPVGWCAVEPRTAYSGLLRVFRTPWTGRHEDKSDDSIWAVTCVFARAGYRRQGISYALAKAAVDFARERGARALEAYPLLTAPGEDVTWGEMLVGSRSIYAAAGMAEVSRPSLRRAVMRIDFARVPRSRPSTGRSAAGRASPASATARRSDRPRG